MRRILLAVAALFGTALTASAATVPYRTDAELVAISDRVVRGRVLDSVVERAPSGAIRTRTRVAVIEDFTGGTDTILTVLERGGGLPDGTTVWIPGAPRFAPGDDVVLCLERTAGGYRTVSMAFSAFRVGAVVAGDRPLTRFGGTTVVGGRGVAGVEASRGLEGFRRTARTVRGVEARTLLTEGQAAGEVAAATPGNRVEAPFVVLGLRWHQADSGQAITWFRNLYKPSPVQGADTDAQVRTALAAWTDPSTAALTLAFGGTRDVVIFRSTGEDPYCNAGNLGAGLITFGDPLNELPASVLAIGGGCFSSSTRVVNGRTFNAFTHAFVILNDDAALVGYRTVPNITRLLEHEVGHGIGLDHTLGGEDSIMYPTCCGPSTPVPPAIGPDDRAALVFIYPHNSQPCSYALSPQPTNIGPMGGEAVVVVTPSRNNCTWTVTSNAAWIIPTEGTSGMGIGSIRFSVKPSPGSQVQRSSTLSISTATATVVQAADVDTDGDTLPDSWESFFGLNPFTALGGYGPDGDLDSDGVSNAAELAAGTHPRAFKKRYLAEGAANAFFDAEVAILNTNGNDISVCLRLQPESGPEIPWLVKVPAHRRLTVLPAIFRSLVPGSFAMIVESDQQVIVDRTMHWDASGYGSHTETALDAPSMTWYLAEGSTSGDFALFYLLQNPGDTSTVATVRFLRPAPQAPIDRSYPLPPHARLTIPVDTVAPELASTDVSGVITATQPIIVERAMYLSRDGQPFAAGHESAGVTTPATEWFLAEGATGAFFDLFVLIENPATQDAVVEVQYLLQGGGAPITKQYVVGAESRFTIYVDDEQIPADSGQRPLASAAVSMRVRSTNSVPIIVERAMWWPQPDWYEAHNAPGTTAAGPRWATAGGAAGGPNNAETYILIANTGATQEVAVVTVYFEDRTPAFMDITLPPQSRTSVPIGATFPEAVGRRFGVKVAAQIGSPALVVERATYESPGGATWTAGAAAVATRVAF